MQRSVNSTPTTRSPAPWATRVELATSLYNSVHAQICGRVELSRRTLERQNLTMRMQMTANAAHECVLEKGCESLSCGCDLLCLLQFLPRPPNAESDAREGSRNPRPHLDAGRIGGSSGSYARDCCGITRLWYSPAVEAGARFELACGPLQTDCLSSLATRPLCCTHLEYSPRQVSCR